MKSKKGIIFILILIFVLVIILAILVNHIICTKGNAGETMIKIDEKAVAIFNNTINSIKSALNYIKYIYLKVTAIQTPEYPADYLPLYDESRVTSYKFNGYTNTLNITSNSADSFDAIYSHYSSFFANSTTVDYLKEYKNDSKYLAYGMIGNFTFLTEISPVEHKKYNCEIKTQLHYLKGDELSAENFFRQQKGPKYHIYNNPYIYMYQREDDDGYVYLQLKDYKSRVMGLDTHVELYINDEFFASRYYGDTIRVPAASLSQICDIKMIAFDNKECIRAINIIENTVCYNADNQTDFYQLAEKYNDANHLFVYNADSITDISHLEFLSALKSIYLEGNDKINDYSQLLKMENLEIIHLKNVDSHIYKGLYTITGLKVLIISDCDINIDLGKDFSKHSCKEIEINNCPNVIFSQDGLFSVDLERLEITRSYTLDSIGFISVYPNLHIIELSECDNLSTLFNTKNLTNLNMLTVNNCMIFDLSQPLDNMPSLMNVEFSSLPGLNSANSLYTHSVWANENILSYNANNCSNVNDFVYYNQPWNEEN